MPQGMQPIVGTGGFDDMIIKRAQEWTKSTSIHFERTLEIEGVTIMNCMSREIMFSVTAMRFQQGTII